MPSISLPAIGATAAASAAAAGGTAAAATVGAGVAAGGAAAAAGGISASTLATIGAVTSVVGTGVQMYSGMQRAAAEKDQSNLIAAKRTREAVAQARIAAGQTTNAAANQGASQSSSAQGGLASIDTQMGSNLAFIGQAKTSADNIASAETLGSFGQAASKLGMFAYDNSDKASKIFG